MKDAWIFGFLIVVSIFLIVLSQRNEYLKRSYQLSMGALLIASWLDRQKIRYSLEYPVQIQGRNYRFDFYLPDTQTFVEFDGRQHFERVPFFHKTEREFREGQQRDILKTNWALQNGYGVVRIATDDDFENILDQAIASPTRKLRVSDPVRYVYLLE